MSSKPGVCSADLEVVIENELFAMHFLGGWHHQPFFMIDTH